MQKLINTVVLGVAGIFVVSAAFAIVQRRLIEEPKTLEDLSAQYGISRERVRQIEVRAFEKLQKAMKNMVVEAAAQPSHRPVLGAIA